MNQTIESLEQEIEKLRAGLAKIKRRKVKCYVFRS
jgi:hypothetical protein